VSDYVRRVDDEAPEPTSYATAVCRCTYSGRGDLTVREYRCRACRAGYGPDREFRSGGLLGDADLRVIRAIVRSEVRAALGETDQ
jgi:hypothetical protein